MRRSDPIVALGDRMDLLQPDFSGGRPSADQRLSSISVRMTIAGCLSPWIFWGCLTRRAPARSSPKDVESDQGAPQDEQQSPQDHDRARLRPDEGGDERGVEAQETAAPLRRTPERQMATQKRMNPAPYVRKATTNITLNGLWNMVSTMTRASDRPPR